MKRQTGDPRHAPREEILSTRGGVIALSVVGGAETATVWWVEREGADGDTTVWRATLPDGAPELLDGPSNVTDLVASSGAVAAVLTGGSVVALDPETGSPSEPLGGS